MFYDILYCRIEKNYELKKQKNIIMNKYENNELLESKISDIPQAKSKIGKTTFDKLLILGVLTIADYIEARKNGILYIVSNKGLYEGGLSKIFFEFVDGFLLENDIYPNYLVRMVSRLTELPKNFAITVGRMVVEKIFTVQDFLMIDSNFTGVSRKCLVDVANYLKANGFDNQEIIKYGFFWENWFVDIDNMQDKKERRIRGYKKIYSEYKGVMNKNKRREKKEKISLVLSNQFSVSSTLLVKIFNFNVVKNLSNHGLKTVEDLNSITIKEFEDIVRDRFALEIVKRYSIKFKEESIQKIV